MSASPLALRRRGSADGLPLVLLHAFPLDSRMWDDVVGHLAGMPILTLDAPGFGSSAPAVGEPALEAYADAVRATLAEAGVDRAVVAGLSMGGYTALALAERHPSLLAGIGLLDTKSTADDRQTRDGRLATAERAEEVGAEVVLGMVEALLAPGTRAGSPEVVERVRGWLGEAPGRSIAWAQRAMAARPDRTAVLQGLGAPGLVLRGADDALSSPEDLATMAGALADVETVDVPEAGHLPALEAPNVVAAALASLHARARVRS